MLDLSDPTLAWLVPGAGAALVVALLMSVVRFVRGPGLPDRIVALDLMAYVVLALTGLIIVATGSRGLIDLSLAIGLSVFLGTIVFARYLERAHLIVAEAGDD